MVNAEIVAPSATLVAATLSVIILSAIFFFVYRSFGQRANIILFVGLNDAGKTTLFTKLIKSKSAWPTYMSMAENKFTQYINQNGVQSTLVDLPGAESLRKSFLTKRLTNERKAVKCIVFVVDSASFARKCKDVAELLYDVLLESDCSIPILVACNKQDDQLKAKTSKAIAAELETEFGLINVSRASSLSSTGGDQPASTVLTSGGAGFCWADLRKRAGRPLVAFAECSAADEGRQDATETTKRSLDAVRQWIDSF